MFHPIVLAIELCAITAIHVFYDYSTLFNNVGPYWASACDVGILVLGVAMTIHGQVKMSKCQEHKSEISWAFVWLHIVVIVAVTSTWLNLLWRLKGLEEIWIQWIGLAWYAAILLAVTVYIQWNRVMVESGESKNRLTGHDGREAGV